MQMRWLVNENLTRFVGVCFPTRGANDFYYISEYCAKGNLKNILANDDIKLDLSFKVSFIKDLARVNLFSVSVTIRARVCIILRLKIMFTDLHIIYILLRQS